MFTSLPNTLLNLAKKGAGGSVINLFGDLAQKLLERIRSMAEEAKKMDIAQMQFGEILQLFNAGSAGALKCAYEIRRWFVGDEGLLSILRNPLSVLKGNPLSVGTKYLRYLSYAVALAVTMRFSQLIALFGNEMRDAVTTVMTDAKGAPETIKKLFDKGKTFLPGQSSDV
jgi:hypothetical protein